jgi:protein Tex
MSAPALALLLPLEQRLAEKLNIQPRQVEATLKLLKEGATVPFIARYRKEVTMGLDDTQLREFESLWQSLVSLDERRESILKSIEEQGKLTPELQNQLLLADSKSLLEDLYLPYKPKRRTKAQIAKEQGLEPLAEQLLKNPKRVLNELAKPFLQGEIKTIEEALEGAQHIVMELLSETAPLLTFFKTRLSQQGRIVSKAVKPKENNAAHQEKSAKFRDYLDFAELLSRIPSHRAMALFRGEDEGILKLSLSIARTDEEEAQTLDGFIQRMEHQFKINLNERHEVSDWLDETFEKAWKTKLKPHLETELFKTLREQAETEAIRVFAVNLKELMLAAPAGALTTLGLDPGFRTGVKWVVVDPTGKLLEYGVIFPHEPQKQWTQSLETLEAKIKQHDVKLVCFGNGTASRETDQLLGDLKKKCDVPFQKMMVSEAGASVYSASALAAKEFPNLDVSYRGAVSIARRLQDPLAELVKIDPKAIGVGQYQHDVNQKQLAQSLDHVVEDCVNAVGVDLNTASVSLLTYISGLNSTLAQNIVDFREKAGRFKSRQQLKKVPRLGDKAFEQCAGFLRIREGETPLDASSVHPEAYPLVEKILKHLNQPIHSVMGNTALIQTLKPEPFTDAQFGVPTVMDIFAELDKPGRDPRPTFKTATFQEGVSKISDLSVGMQLEGVVTNVTNFGAFVDIGVHQDGLVHISQLADTFVKDPHQVVRPGQIVTVRVTEVDAPRKRIGLSMKSGK